MDPSKPRKPRTNEAPEEMTSERAAEHTRVRERQLAEALTRARALLDEGSLSAPLRARLLSAMEQADRLGHELEALFEVHPQGTPGSGAPPSPALGEGGALPVEIAGPLRALAEIGDLEAFVQVAQDLRASHPELHDALSALLKLASAFRINDITASLRHGEVNESPT